MALLDELAEGLARDAFALARKTGDESVISEVEKTLGTTSPTMQETYNTAIRLLRAEARGRAVIEARATGSGGG